MCICVSVCVHVGVGVRYLVRLRVSAYCLPCRHGDDIMAHGRRTTERIPPHPSVFFTDGKRERERRGGEIERERKEEGKVRRR